MAVSIQVEERVPLITAEVKGEEEELEDGRLAQDLRELQQEFERQYPRHAPQAPTEPAVAAATGYGEPGAAAAGDDVVRKKRLSGNEMIVAVFVVAFDTKRGNLVEWQYPKEVSLDGVEFKSLASGLHNVSKDFIYFKKGQLYGLSCYEKIPVANQEERGARMRSVGLLAVGYSDLHLHKEFLQRQVRTQVETPGQYGSLEEYFRHYHPLAAPINASTSSTLAIGSLPHMEITHPAGCFTQFLQFFGPSVFVLWRLSLLKKKIVLFSPPPIGVVCYRVYCACLLASHVLKLDIDTDCNPQFYVNVADIEQLRTLGNYIACTTERIFKEKHELYDVFVDNQNITTHLSSLEPLLRVTPGDHQRFHQLSDIRSNQIISSGGVGTAQANDDFGFASFFQELNSQLFRTVQDAASSEDHVLTVEMVNSLGLHPVKDRFFLTELAAVHRLDINVQRPQDMIDLCYCCA